LRTAFVTTSLITLEDFHLEKELFSCVNQQNGAEKIPKRYRS